MSPELAILLSRVRAAKSPDSRTDLWLSTRPLAETWASTWEAVPNAEMLAALARLAGCLGLWIEDAERRADAEVARVRLACKPSERPLVATAGARGFRSVIGHELVAMCLRHGERAEA